jgi:acetate kinase
MKNIPSAATAPMAQPPLFVSMAAAQYLNDSDLKMVTCHLGNGSSISAVNAGKCVDTSMGLTPLAGVLMGTRCGDIDPSVVTYMETEAGIPRPGNG